MLNPANWTSFRLQTLYKRKKDLILTKLELIYVQKSTTFVNRCDFSVNLIPALIYRIGRYPTIVTNVTQYMIGTLVSRNRKFLRYFMKK